ncbi:MAG: hypothetical protein ACRCYS_15075 [Beijerinckiaceae bacterium]
MAKEQRKAKARPQKQQRRSSNRSTAKPAPALKPTIIEGAPSAVQIAPPGSPRAPQNEFQAQIQALQREKEALQQSVAAERERGGYGPKTERAQNAATTRGREIDAQIEKIALAERQEYSGKLGSAATGVGIAAGLTAGSAAAKKLDKVEARSNAAKNKELRKLGKVAAGANGNRAAAAATAADKLKLVPGGKVKRGLSTAGKLGVGGAAVLALEGLLARSLANEANEQPEMQAALRAGGTALTVAGLTQVGKRSATVAMTSNIPDARSVAAIEEARLNAKNPPGKQPRAIKPGSKADLVRQAQAVGVAKPHAMNKTQLKEALAKAAPANSTSTMGKIARSAGKLALPLAIAATAIVAGRDAAQAGEGPEAIAKVVSKTIVDTATSGAVSNYEGNRATGQNKIESVIRAAAQAVADVATVGMFSTALNYEADHNASPLANRAGKISESFRQQMRGDGDVDAHWRRLDSGKRVHVRQHNR